MFSWLRRCNDPSPILRPHARNDPEIVLARFDCRYRPYAFVLVLLRSIENARGSDDLSRWTREGKDTVIPFSSFLPWLLVGHWFSSSKEHSRVKVQPT